MSDREYFYRSPSCIACLPAKPLGGHSVTAKTHNPRDASSVLKSDRSANYKGHGFGVRRIESAGKGRAVIIHTATGIHLRQLEAMFHVTADPRFEVGQTD